MIKRTLVTPEQEFCQRDRPGFVAACCYGSIAPEENEMGGIFRNFGNMHTERGLIVEDAECVERIFVNPQFSEEEKAFLEGGKQ